MLKQKRFSTSGSFSLKDTKFSNDSYKQALLKIDSLEQALKHAQMQILKNSSEDKLQKNMKMLIKENVR